MRLIDADKLIESICQEECERHYSDCDYTCSSVSPVVNAPTIEGDRVTWHTMDTLPERGEQVLLWRGLSDDDGGFPAVARAVFFHGEIVIRYKSEGRDWEELTRDEYPATMWARIPRPTMDGGALAGEDVD